MVDENGKLVKKFVSRVEKMDKNERIVIRMQEILQLQALSEKRKLSQWEVDGWSEAWCDLEDAF